MKESPSAWWDLHPGDERDGWYCLAGSDYAESAAYSWTDGPPRR
jgi:hypothetical protein